MLLSLLVAALLAGSSATADPTDAKSKPAVRVGMSTALSGPAAHLGIQMRRGVELAFARANAEGGIGGRRLELVALDDGYEPARTTANMRELAGDPSITAVIGNVGTPTAVAALPIVRDTGLAFFGAFTGADILRKDPPDPNVYNVRASYREETAAMVEGLVVQGGLAPSQIAVFTQRDAYGDSGYAGVLAALRRHGLPESAHPAHGRYARNTVDIEDGLAEILLAPVPPRAVLLVGAYEPCAAFIRTAREVGCRAVFLNISFVGGDVLAQRLGALGDGVIVTQVVPHPESSLPFVAGYRAAAARCGDEAAPTHGSLEGYLCGELFVRALRAPGSAPTRAAVPQLIARLGRVDVGLGVELRLDEQEHQASHAVWPTVIRDGRVMPFEWAEIRTLLDEAQAR